ELARGFAFFTTLDLGNAFRRDEHVVNEVAHLFGLDALDEVVVHFALLSGEDVHCIPLIFARWNRHFLLFKWLFRHRADDVDEDEIPKRDIAREQQHRDDDNHRGVDEFLVFFEPAFLRLPRPTRLGELDFDFADELFRFRNHLKIMNESWNAEWMRPLRGSSCFLHFHSAFKTRQEGLEPPTGGFGDRYSTN